MMYLIVHYDPSTMTYVIDHYSHNFDDALTQYEKFYTLYGTNCKLMIDERVLEVHEMRMKHKELTPKLAEIRKQYKDVHSTAPRVEN